MTLNKQQGFSLLEILVAFAILALSLGILLKIFSGGANTALLAEEYSVAVQIAESLLAKTGVESALEFGETHGEEDGKYTWSVSVSPYPFTLDDMDMRTVKAEFFKVDVLVAWGDDGRELQLSTIRLANKALHEPR